MFKQTSRSPQSYSREGGWATNRCFQGMMGGYVITVVLKGVGGSRTNVTREDGWASFVPSFKKGKVTFINNASIFILNWCNGSQIQ